MFEHTPSSTDSGPQSDKTRVVVADDHPIVRAGIITELSRHADMAVVGEAVNGDDAFALVCSREVDVLVLDINMPGLKVFDLVRHLDELSLPTQVLIMTGHNDAEIAVALIRAGAKGYILKDEEPSTITAAVRAVAEGKRWLSPQILDSVFDHTMRENEQAEEPDLSARETEVLRLLSEGNSNQEISERLHISERTVRFHLRNIYDKLGLKRGQAIAWAVRNRLKDES